MRKLIQSGLAATTIAVVLSAVALLAHDQRHPCNLGTLRGSYAFNASGFNIVGGAALPKAIVEVLEFNGDGTLSTSAVTTSVNGTIVRSRPGADGTFTLADDCTGTVSFLGGPSFDIAISTKGDRGSMIQTNPNSVFQGTLARVAREGRDE